MSPAKRLIGPLLGAILFVSGSAASGKTEAPAYPGEPVEVLKAFLTAFHAFDYETCHSFFTEDAKILIVRRQQGTEFGRHFLDVHPWLDEVGEATKGIENFRMEFHDSVAYETPLGVTVTLRATGRGLTPRGKFTNQETSSANLIKIDGHWRIVQYNTFEDFRWD